MKSLIYYIFFFLLINSAFSKELDLWLMVDGEKIMITNGKKNAKVLGAEWKSHSEIASLKVELNDKIINLDQIKVCFGERFKLIKKEIGYLSQGEQSTIDDDVKFPPFSNSPSAVCGASNLSGDITLNQADLKNVVINVMPEASLYVDGRIIGEPIALLDFHFPNSTLSGNFEGSISSLTTKNFQASGKGPLVVIDQEYGWMDKRVSIDLDGELSIQNVGAFLMDTMIEVRGIFNFGDYSQVSFFSINSKLIGNGTFSGYGMNNPYSYLGVGVFELNGSASVQGSAHIEGSAPYTSLNLSVPDKDDNLVFLWSGGGDVSVSGDSQINVDWKDFSMHHNCDNRVEVLMGGAPSGFSLNPEADNESKYLYCTYENGEMKCPEPRWPPCFQEKFRPSTN